MNRFLNKLIWFMIVLVSYYLVLSFYEWNLNPSKWWIHIQDGKVDYTITRGFTLVVALGTILADSAPYKPLKQN